MQKSGKILIGMMGAILIFYATAFPVLVSAQASGLVPCGAVDTNGDGMISGAEECGWDDFFVLITNVTNYIIVLGAAFSAIAFGWAGFLMMTAAGEMSKIEHAKSIFGKVLIGFLIMLSAWLIVHAINAGLIDNSFINNAEVKPI